jgi:hypothetical protein
MIMSKIKLYIDEDASREAFVSALRRAKIDCLTTLEANNLGCSDSEQLTWATDNNRVIYTFNVRDYCKLHKIYMKQEKNHPGIIVVERQSYSIGEQLRGIEKLIDTFPVEQMKNQLIFIGIYIRS